MVTQRFKQWFGIGALILLLLNFIACGGSSSSSEAPSISGVVADGYLSGARVFLDLNNNRLWDTDEPYALSSDDGTYTISEITAEDYDSFPVVAEVTVTTTDQDTGKTVSHPYTLVSPAGRPEFISPLTTMVQVSYESNPDITLDEAHAAVKEMLSMEDATGVDLFTDYVEEKTDGDSDAAAYAKLHNVAQLSARIMGANLADLETAADSAGVDVEAAKDDLLRLAVKEIMQSMELIEDTATEETDFDADQKVQALQIEFDTSDIAAEIESVQAALQYQVPALRWAAVLRDHRPDGSKDMLFMALEQELTLTDYVFSVVGPDDTEHLFSTDDLYEDPYAPVAWYKLFDSLPEGTYTFYVTVPGGQKIAVASETHAHDEVPSLELSDADVVIINGAYSRVYHDTLNGTYYYRMAILHRPSGEIVYRSKIRERNVQYFPSEYATADYDYRLEVWNHRLLKDATARSRTAWTALNPGGSATAVDTYTEFFKGYRRIRYGADGITTTGSSNRLVLQIGITNPDDIAALVITDPAGDTFYEFDLSLTPGEEASEGGFYFLRGSGTNNDGVAYADYFLMIFGSTANGEYTWHVDTVSGDDFTRSVTIYDQTALPCVDPSSVVVTEDTAGDITFAWDAVNWGGKSLFYRVSIVKGEDWDNGYYALRVPTNQWTGSKSDIEAVIGGALDGGDVVFSVWVIDSQYPSTVHNRTDFAPVDLSIGTAATP
ncbi:MAG: hypothetical protein QNJ22_17970 [Desulfosarcinaceae bacterium]|nr:hypothetical protein [Desulfosarcinaceae bacterium]